MNGTEGNASLSSNIDSGLAFKAAITAASSREVTVSTRLCLIMEPMALARLKCMSDWMPASQCLVVAWLADGPIRRQ